jgi:anaerobic magnesium-protoporphyrin IX monomethyl ester cyclase
MRILLADPPGKNKGLNTGLGYLSALLKARHDVRVLDLNNIEMGLCGDPNPEVPISELEARIRRAMDDFDPQVFGLSVKTFSTDICRHILKRVETHRPRVTTIVGGPHITLDGISFIQENAIDFGVQGEGEYTALQLCDALEDNRPVENVKGLIYWRNGQPALTQAAEAIRDLDALPFPFYDHFSSVSDYGGSIPEYPLLTSRGCPYQCSYCSMPQIMGEKWRAHSPSRVIQELHHAKEKYGSTRFTIVDDNFTLNLSRVENICDRLISDHLKLTWNSQNGIRADRIDRDLATKMRRSGCRHVWIGIESADEKVFAAINKGERLDSIRKGIGHLKKAGIRVGGFFIVGLPESTRESDLKSIDFAKKNGIDGWWFNFVPYPRTTAMKWVQAHGRWLRPLHGALQYGAGRIEPVFDTPEYPKEARIKTYDEIHIRLRLFARLADPSLKPFLRWRRVFKKIAPKGLPAIASFFVFLLEYYVRIALRKISARPVFCRSQERRES